MKPFIGNTYTINKFKTQSKFGVSLTGNQGKRWLPLAGSIVLFLFVLFGGVLVKQNGIALGTTSCHAITVSSPPANEKANQKHNRFYNRISRWFKSDNTYSGLGRMVIIILVVLAVATIGFGIWSVALLTASKYAAGVIVGLLGLASLFGIIKFLLS